MRRVSTARIITILPWLICGLIGYHLVGLFAPNAYAQEPTPIPTPTLANTPTPTQAPPTETPVPGAATATPTAISAEATPAGRLITFRANKDKIDAGECVTFSWAVKGDIGFVEFNIEDDGIAPEIVAETGNRQECPTEDTRYRLFVTWLNNTQTTTDKLKVEVRSSSSGDSGSSSSSSGGDAANVPPPGAFVAVTPIFISEPAREPTPISVSTESTSANAVAAEADPGVTGIFREARVLPETGSGQPLAGAPDLSARSSEMAGFTARYRTANRLWLRPLGGLMLVLVTLIVGVGLTTKFGR